VGIALAIAFECLLRRIAFTMFWIRSRVDAGVNGTWHEPATLDCAKIENEKHRSMLLALVRYY
jgi:hypothetical protein